MTKLAPDPLDERYNAEAPCEVIPEDNTACTRPVSWRVCIHCHACDYKPTGNICQHHRDAIHRRDGVCYCGTPFYIVWERPV